MKSFTYLFLCTLLTTPTVWPAVGSIEFSTGPCWPSAELILFPTDLVTTSMPLVTQSSTKVPLNLASCLNTHTQLNVNKYLNVYLDLGGSWLRNAQGSVRSFSKDPLDPTSARSTPFIIVARSNSIAFDTGARINIPAFKEVNFQLAAGYRLSHTKTTLDFLQNTTIFFSKSKIKGPYASFGTSITVQTITIGAGYEIMKATFFSISTQNSSQLLVIRTAPMRGNFFMFHILYKLNNYLTLGQSIGYGDVKNTEVGISTTFNAGIEQGSPVPNVARIQGKTITLTTKLMYEF